MNVDVSTSIVIHRPPREVAAYAAHPDNAPVWYANIHSVEWQTPRPLRVGSRIAFVAFFLFKRLDYTYEIVEFVPDERLVMRTAQGPFPMETTYTWELVESGTRMTLRNRGTPAGFSRVVAPFVAAAVRRANEKDLARLRDILESTIDDPALGPLRHEPWFPNRKGIWRGTVADGSVKVLIESDRDAPDLEALSLARESVANLAALHEAAVEYLHRADPRPWNSLHLRSVEIERLSREWVDQNIDDDTAREALRHGALAVTLQFGIEGDLNVADVSLFEGIPVAWDYH